jgi:hypothetical protein
MIETRTMTSPTKPLRQVRILHIILVAVIVATIPCYCLGIQVIRRAPVVDRPTTTATVSPSGIPTTAVATASRTPIPPYVTRTYTPVPPFFTPYTPTTTFTPEPTATNTPTFTLTPSPTFTPTLNPTQIAGTATAEYYLTLTAEAENGP